MTLEAKQRQAKLNLALAEFPIYMEYLHDGEAVLFKAVDGGRLTDPMSLQSGLAFAEGYLQGWSAALKEIVK